MKKSQYSAFLLFTILILFGYTLLRANFLFLNGIELKNAYELQSLALGFRYDMAAFALLNGPLFLLMFFPRDFSKAYSKVLSQVAWACLFVLNFSFFALNLIDAEWFRFTKNRVTIHSFSISEDIQHTWGALFSDYGLPILGYGLALLVFFYALARALGKHRAQSQLPSLKESLFTYGLLSLLLFGAGRGIGYKPLSVPEAFRFRKQVLGHVAMNSSFSFLKSLAHQKQKAPHFSISFQEALQTIESQTDTKRRHVFLEGKEGSLKNVVIIIMESLALEYTKEALGENSLTPFFDSIADKSWYFPNHYANGSRSIDALSSIFLSIPALMDQPFVTSAFSSNSVFGVGETMSEAGFQHTQFFHGGRNGTMYFDALAARAGLEEYFGLNEYPDKDGFDGDWGIYDDKMFTFFKNTLDQNQEPFFSALFTLSAHSPYNIPEKFSHVKRPNSDGLQNAVRYSDESLRVFFELAEKSPWFKNTLFVITGDHTSINYHEKFKGTFEKFRVPLAFYAPSSLPAQQDDQIAQHADISPTTIDLLQLDVKKKNLLGRSLLRGHSGRALLYSSPDHLMVTKDAKLRFRQDDMNFHPFSRDSKMEKASISLFESLLKYYFYGLTNNKLIQ